MSNRILITALAAITLANKGDDIGHRRAPASRRLVYPDLLAAGSYERELHMPQGKRPHAISTDRFLKTEIHTLFGPRLILITMVPKAVEKEEAANKNDQQKETG